jgi:hypothetical protein
MAQAQASWRVEWYTKATGEQPARAFVEGLEGRNRDEAIALIERLRRDGNTIREPHSKPVQQGVLELRGHQVRLLYTFRPGRRAVLLNGVIKKQDKLPAGTVKDAVVFKRDLEKREGEK